MSKRTIALNIVVKSLAPSVLLMVSAGAGAQRDDRAGAATVYDVVILNGRVMDPESGRDEVASIGISGDRIAAITTDRIKGRNTINARGNVVAPGFIDALVYPSTGLVGQQFKIADGVTTQLQMHAGPVDIASWYNDFARAGMLTNYGSVVGHGALREAVGVTDRYKDATADEIGRMQRLADEAIKQGAIGIGYGLGYVPGASQLETVGLFEVARRNNVPNHVHVRFDDPFQPGTSIEAINEVIAAAAITGARAEIVHLNSGGGTHVMDTAINILASARRNGIDISANIYPYDGWSTYIGSSVFDGDFLIRKQMSYSDIELISTGERLTKERFDELRAKAPPQSDNRLTDPNLIVIGHAMPESDTLIALSSPFVWIASDGSIGENMQGHPRGAGTFSRILGVYVREKKVLSLMDAIRKMTLLPAQRMEVAAPSMKDRGRLRAGAYADITIFDPDAVLDQATYAHPAQHSRGINFVLVNGTKVYERGRFVTGVKPGMPVRHD